LARFRREWQEELRHGPQGQEVENEDEVGEREKKVCQYRLKLGQDFYSYMDSTYGVILRIVKTDCHPVAITQVVEH